MTLIFVILHLAPGDPTSTYFSPRIPPEVLEQMRRNMGLDQPIHVQYVQWLRLSLSGDFGYSYSEFRPVTSVLADRLPNTLLLGTVSLVLIFVVGCFIGAVQAVRKYSKLDSVLTFFALLIYSVPGFWLGLMLVLLVSSGALGWLNLPVSGMLDVNHEFMSPIGRMADIARHLVMPTIALGLASAAGVARYMRGELLEVIGQDYIRTARAKGLREGTVIWRHALRNALLPVITLLGLYLPLLIGGTVVIEVVFAWPGMGRLLYDGILARDYPLVTAASFLFAVIVLAGNLLADLLYAAVDPRIRLGARE